jgi:DNA-binding protein H-NS
MNDTKSTHDAADDSGPCHIEIGKEMEISKLATKDLQVLLKRISREIDKRSQREKSKLVDEIAQMASKRGYSLKELIGKAPRPARAKKALRRRPAAVKYRHPEQANLTWTGRGKKPLWVTKWLEEGNTMEALAV